MPNARLRRGGGGGAGAWQQHLRFHLLCDLGRAAHPLWASSPRHLCQREVWQGLICFPPNHCVFWGGVWEVEQRQCRRRQGVPSLELPKSPPQWTPARSHFRDLETMGGGA